MKHIPSLSDLKMYLDLMQNIKLDPISWKTKHLLFCVWLVSPRGREFQMDKATTGYPTGSAARQNAELGYFLFNFLLKTSILNHTMSPCRNAH